jgi:hypothetical protein
MNQNGAHSDLKQKRRELERARKVLRAIRNVNQPIGMEKDPERLLAEVCRLLSANRGYFNAWIARGEDGRPAAPFFDAGFDGGFAPLAAPPGCGDLPDCGKKAMERPDPMRKSMRARSPCPGS